MGGGGGGDHRVMTTSGESNEHPTSTQRVAIEGPAEGGAVGRSLEPRGRQRALLRALLHASPQQQR